MDNDKKKQAKLDSVDFLMLLLVRFDVCSERTGFKIFQRYRWDVFYKRFRPSGQRPVPRIEKIFKDQQ